jgi:hypothetical protein
VTHYLAGPAFSLAQQENAAVEISWNKLGSIMGLLQMTATPEKVNIYFDGGGNKLGSGQTFCLS